MEHREPRAARRAADPARGAAGADALTGSGRRDRRVLPVGRAQRSGGATSACQRFRERVQPARRHQRVGA